jgi:hypothetical protein
MGKFFSKTEYNNECIDCGDYYDMNKKYTFENRCKKCTKLYFKELQNHVLKNYCKHSDKRKKKVKYLCYVMEDVDDDIMIYSKKNRKSMYSHKFYICKECEENASYHYPVVIKDI